MHHILMRNRVFDIPSGVFLDERIVIVMAEIVFNWYELISV
jgi:hypothetical protein